MELVLIFIGASVFIGIISWINRASERLRNLEEEVYLLKNRKAKESHEIAESHPDEPTPPVPPEESLLSAAKKAAGPTERRPAPEPLASPKPIPKDLKPEPEPVTPKSIPAPATSPTAPPLPASASKTPVHPRSPEDAEEKIKPLFEWRPILEKLYLWPPSGENAESALFGWWLTRIGLVLLVIAAAFLGVWVSDYISPIVRVTGLAGIATGVTLLGLWLERRLQAFGRVLSAGGLALGYFTAFAAFALPAMKIIDDPVLGVVVQIGALAIAIGWSLWKRDETVAAMAILLGYISCGFSHHHDLDNLVIGGLLLLAAGGGLLLVMRRWLWTHAIASAGSWGGFLILALGEWSVAGEAPPFSILLGSLLLLTAILEAANCLTEVRLGSAPESRPRERKLLSVFNTSAAIAAGWLATARAYPEQLATFFLAFAILLFAITTVRYLTKSPSGLTETFFLKAIALLAFFFVERFDGPTRWLSLAVESGAVLWAYRRTGSRWVELAFGAVFAGTLGLILNDLFTQFEPWPLLSIASLAGAISFVILSIELGLHSFWRSRDDNLESIFEPKILEIGRLVAAATVGLAASEFCSWLTVSQPESSLPFALSILALALAAPAIFLRRFPPIAAGTVALVWAYVMVTRDFFQPPGGSGIAVSAWLAVLGFGLAESVFHFWQKRWHGGNAFRAGFYILGLGALALLFCSIDIRGEIAEIPGMILAGAFAAVGGIALILMRRSFSDDSLSAGKPFFHHTSQKVLALAAGFLATVVTLQFFDAGPWFRNLGQLSAWLALTGAILFTSAFWTRNAVPALAGGIPFLLGLVSYLLGFDENSILKDHLICAAVLVAVGSGAALILNRRIDLSRQKLAAVSEKILHVISLLVIHWIFRSHLALSEIFFADALLAIGCVCAGGFRPLRSLPLISSLPLALALLHAVVSIGDWHTGTQVYWWLAATLAFAWLWAVSSTFSTANNPALTDRKTLTTWHGMAATGVLTLAGYHSLDAPWHLVTLSVFGLLTAALWRWKKTTALEYWAFVPAAFAAVGSLLQITGNLAANPTNSLIAISLASAIMVVHGVVLAFRNRVYRTTAWATGAIPLMLVFLAFAPGNLGVAQLTTVCWGVAAILLFVAGLIAGLRAYRLVGLVGLSLCLFRMFVYDINDPLYRIFAFFAIALVLLAMGYLYHRFRHWIERADHLESDSE